MNLILAGRQWPTSQKNSSISDECVKIKAIENNHCNRCGQRVYASLPNGKKYCRSCIGLDRITEEDYLIRCLHKFTFKKIKNGGLSWQGKLTMQQKELSDNLVINFRAGHSSLVHAVTGAGKTEMLFDLIAECIKNGLRACIATPRIDVVNELFPRFQTAFKKIKIGKYHGKNYCKPACDQIVICTTHQLLKFYHAFDLLVIDEVDSFPYVENKQLHFAAKQAIKPHGVNTYLTATPTKDLLDEVEKNKLKILKLKHRFHGGLLPIPKEKLFLKPFVDKGKINPLLLREIINVIVSGHPLLLFIPRVAEVDFYLRTLKKCNELENTKIKGVHAADPKRLEKVEEFRAGQIDLLITTTILERGVTFKHVWVIIVSADDLIYQTANLVQIAGRVGRDKTDRDGLVLYCYHKYTRNIRDAIKQIKEMNQ